MDLKFKLALLALSLSFTSVYAQTDSTLALNDNLNKSLSLPLNLDKDIYKLNAKYDIPIIAIAGGWSGFAFTKIYSKDKSTDQQILDLKKSDIPKFDRWAAGMSDDKAAMVSDYLFYGSIPYVFTLFIDKDIRQDALKIGVMYLEAMSVTGLFYTGSVYLVDRYRPETYDTSQPVEDRTSGNFKDSFIAGHPALVATSTFFAARVYADYHPESKLKYAGYGIAIAATGTTAYLRHLAGKHFPTDLILGTTVGTLSGLLVPKFHKNRSANDNNLGIYPYFNGNTNGITAIYSFK